MLLVRPDRTPRSRLLALFVSCVFTTLMIYEWDTFISEPTDRILPYFSIPTSNGDFGVIKETVDPNLYREIYSASTIDRKYFLIDFVDRRSINPNIVPHPTWKDVFVVVAQLHDPDSTVPMGFAEITCNAAFENDTLRCMHSPSILPVTTKPGDKCDGDILILNINKGPHDARVFYGPERAYAVYGSNSKYTCFGQFIHDLRSLIDWGQGPNFTDIGFKNSTELQRPPPYGRVEKNWFIFWDQDGQMYVHYDISPKRTFAKLGMDGSVGEDLAPKAAEAGDEKCLAKHLPKVGPFAESLHQATNSLSVTLCKRSDPSCKPNDTNTFILTIFQHKIYRYFHSVYEPYAMLFSQKAPFKIHGISTKPFWIHGRWKPTEPNDEIGRMEPKILNGKWIGWNQTEMMYVTSMNWRGVGQRYHGYIDDVVFLGFGIEDSMSAGIDVVVGDLLLDIGMC